MSPYCVLALCIFHTCLAASICFFPTTVTRHNYSYSSLLQFAILDHTTKGLTSYSPAECIWSLGGLPAGLLVFGGDMSQITLMTTLSK